MKQETQTKIDTFFYVLDKIVDRVFNYSVIGLIIYAIFNAIV